MSNKLSSSINKLLPFFNRIGKKSGMPFSMDIMPTNRCNRDCSFCSNKNKDSTEELTLEQINEVLLKFPSMRAVELTGGGEPLCHMYINDIIDMLYRRSIQIGLVTNGHLLNKIKDKIKYIEWIRISVNGLVDDDEKIPFKLIPDYVYTGLNYVYHNKSHPDYVKKIRKIMKKNKNLKYARIINDGNSDLHENTDILIGNNIYYFDRVMQKIESPCYLGSIKPALAPNGKLYACCAICWFNKEMKYLDKDAITIEDILNWKPFDCPYDKCSFSDKNAFVKEALNHNYKHVFFL